MNIHEALAWATNYLQQHGIDNPHFEAEVLLGYVLEVKKVTLFARPEVSLSPQQIANYQACLKRRASHEPTAYITGIQPFMSLDFFVDHSVLIPRPETEQLVEKTIEIIHTFQKSRKEGIVVLDIGTGSGCIAVSLAKYLSNVRVIGIDSSVEAIEVAKKNAEYHRVYDRCQFILGDIFRGLEFKIPVDTKFDLIVSNPPYIPTSEIDNLQPEVKNWEPRQALDGGSDGLDYIRFLISDCPKYLMANGYLVFEFGENQAREILRLAQGRFGKVEIINDYFGKERFFVGKF